MKKIILALILLVTISACKSDKKNDKTGDTVKETPEIEVPIEENVIITLNAVVPNDDTFVVQFTEDATYAFRAKDIVESKITGSNVAQNISFKLPNKVIPTKFMLKVGTNNTKNVVINSININNEEREFNINKNNLFQFLNANKFIDYNRESKTYTTKEVGGKLIPAFISRPLLIQRLEEKVY